MGAAWDRLMEERKKKKAQKAESSPESPVFAPKDAKYTNARDRLSGGDWLDINIYGKVGAVRHDPKTSILYVRFPVGRSYAYKNCDIDLAIQLLNAGASKTTPAGGTWVWDHLRIRGTRTGHQKPYREVTGQDEPIPEDFPGWRP